MDTGAWWATVHGLARVRHGLSGKTTTTHQEYKDFSLPQGYYTSLKITVGEGDGANWWCVMYPPMCLDIATSEAEYTDEEYRLISPSGYRVKFKLLELASELTRKRK